MYRLLVVIALNLISSDDNAIPTIRRQSEAVPKLLCTPRATCDVGDPKYYPRRYLRIDDSPLTFQQASQGSQWPHSAHEAMSKLHFRFREDR